MQELVTLTLSPKKHLDEWMRDVDRGLPNHPFLGGFKIWVQSYLGSIIPRFNLVGSIMSRFNQPGFSEPRFNEPGFNEPVTQLDKL